MKKIVIVFVVLVILIVPFSASAGGVADYIPTLAPDSTYDVLPPLPESVQGYHDYFMISRSGKIRAFFTTLDNLRLRYSNGKLFGTTDYTTFYYIELVSGEWGNVGYSYPHIEPFSINPEVIYYSSINIYDGDTDTVLIFGTGNKDKKGEIRAYHDFKNWKPETTGYSKSYIFQEFFKGFSPVILIVLGVIVLLIVFRKGWGFVSSQIKGV